MIWIITILLIMLAGLNAPLAACALSLAALNGFVVVRPDLAWIATPTTFLATLTLLITQLLADVYFVPITVRDRIYLNPHRTQNAYLHARIQSLARPLMAAVIATALPLPVPDWTAAVFGFTSATGMYWLSAWVREHVAVARGAIVLLVIETMKNGALMMLALLTFWFAPLALVLLLVLLVQTVVWTTRLHREQILYAHYGGQRVGEDS